MKKIYSIHLELLKNPEHFNFAEFVKKALLQYNLADGIYSRFVKGND